MSSLLDKLAMELGQWPECYLPECAVLRLRDIDSAATWVRVSLKPQEWKAVKRSVHGDVYVAVAKVDWMQRRKELINEPDDADAPEWAKWVAQDSNGFWYWHENEPSLDRLGWQSNGRLDHAGEGEVPAGRDWRKTLKEVKRETKVELEETVDPIESEIIRAIAMIRVETDEDVRFSLVGHLDALLGAVRNKLLDSAGWESTNLTQRKIQSVIDSGEYREMEGVTVLVNENGHAAIVNYGGAFYWVDNDAMAREWDLAGEGND